MTALCYPLVQARVLDAGRARWSPELRIRHRPFARREVIGPHCPVDDDAMPAWLDKTKPVMSETAFQVSGSRGVFRARLTRLTIPSGLLGEGTSPPSKLSSRGISTLR